MMKKILLLTSILLLLISCGKKDEEEDPYIPKVISEWSMSCLRWIDRELVFSTSSAVNNERNNPFDIQSIQDVIKLLEVNTRLGEDYFRIKTKQEDLLQPIRPSNLKWEDYDSFILVWEDAKFNQFVNENLGGFSSVPDRNAITVVHSKFKRKFYMIFRASCFDGTAGFQCGQIGIGGVNALIARQFGFLFGLPPANCSTDPDNILCPIAKDSQWSNQSRENFYQTLTSQLITIENNKNYYNDESTASSCLNKQWMDRELVPASPEGQKNNTFFIQDVYDSLNEVACSTMLGCGYFYRPELTVPEKDIPIYLEKTETNTRGKSHLMIWPDVSLNTFVSDNDLFPADPNALVFINQAYKRNYSMIFRSSCFDSNNPMCDGGNGGITRNGLSSLVARQLGLLVGLRIKDCSKEPTHVMCGEVPNDLQWTETEKTRFFNQFNNALEYIGNNKDFYFEHVIILEPEEED